MDRGKSAHGDVFVRPTVKGFKGQKWSKTLKKSNSKNNSVDVFYMDRDAKVSMVTSLSDLSLRGQGSKKVKNLNYFQ